MVLCEKDIKGARVKRVQLQSKKHYLNYCSESCLRFLGLASIFTLVVVNCMHGIKSTENS